MCNIFSPAVFEFEHIVVNDIFFLFSLNLKNQICE